MTPLRISRWILLVAILVTTAVAAEPGSGPTKAPTTSNGSGDPRLQIPFHPDLPKVPDRRFNVAAFGAIGDGATDNTKAIQATIDAARKAGGGTVEIPAGVFLSGPIELGSRIALDVDAGATLRMLPFDRYPGGTSHPDDFISGSNLHDVAISGSGTIDGQGQPWWPYARVKGARRPRMIELSACERVLIEGVSLKNSPMFHIAISGHSSHVTVRGVTIRAPASTDPVTPSHNTDACDVSGRMVLIENCDVSVGDDNFTCGGGTSDVLIINCKYGYGHGVSIGSYTKGGVSNIAVVNCTFDRTECGIRIKSDRDRGGIVQHLRYENLRMNQVGCPIEIYGAYMAQDRKYRDLNRLTPAVAATYPSAPVEAHTPIYRDIVFRNIMATAAPGRRAGLIWGLPEAPITNLTLDNVDITAELPFGIFDAAAVRLNHTTIRTPAGVEPIMRYNADVATSP